MVDPDRLDDLTGGGNSKSESSSDSKSTTKKRSSSKDKEMTKEDKLSHFGADKSKKSTSKSSGRETEDIKRLLFTLANMDGYARALQDHKFDQLNKPQNSVKEDFAKDVTGEIINFLGVFNVRDISDKYGYEWDQVLNTALDNRDISGDTLRTNSGNVSSDDVKELLDCIANVLLYVEGTLRSKEDMEDKEVRDATIEVVAENAYEQYKTIISKSGVQRIAERHGYDWEEDVVKHVLKTQDFEKKLKGE